MTSSSTPVPGGIARAIVRRPWVIIGAAAAVVFALWVSSTRSDPHHVRVALPSALNLVSGLDVQVDGIDAGKISKVDYDNGKAVVELGIDDAHWPIHQGATATVRYGTTIGNGTRKIDLDPGKPSAPAIPDGGVIPAKDAFVPVEIDEVFRMLDARTRKDLQGVLGHAADGLRGNEAALNAGVARSAKGLSATGALISDLAADTDAMHGLVANAGRAARVIAARREAVSNLVSVAAATFDEFGRRSAAMRDSLTQLPPTLTQVRGTLDRLDGSVSGLHALFTDLRPGATALRALTPSVRSAVSRLRRVAPTGTATVAALRDAAPDVRALLGEAPPVVKQLTPTLAQLAPIAACIRPYAPEAAGALSNWASYTRNYDGTTHYGRVLVTASQTSANITPDFTSEQYTKLFPTINYAMPRPPGFSAGKPWFLPECGVGPDSVNPAKDPEDPSVPNGSGPARAARADAPNPSGTPRAAAHFGGSVLRALTTTLREVGR